MPVEYRKSVPPVRPRRRIRIEIRPKSMIIAALVIFCAWLFIKLLPVVLVLVVALMIVGTFSPAVAWLEARKIRRGGGIAIVFGSLSLAFLAMMVLTIPALIEQVKSLVEQEPALRRSVAEFLMGSPLTASLGEALTNLKYDALIKDAGEHVLAYSKSLVEVVAYSAGAFFLALYIMIDRDRLRGAAFAVIPRAEHIRFSRILINLETIVGGYIRGQVVTCLMMGGFMFILLTACGVPNALALSVFGGIADVLPFIGIFLTMGPAVLAALVKGPVIVAIVFVAMLAYEEFESRV
ncbi:MAG: AI-2E family transporter, partial [Lacisediminimonas sp.]|nr:AI-2E family transporter [Lacisediminimonas sp.]